MVRCAFFPLRSGYVHRLCREAAVIIKALFLFKVPHVYFFPRRRRATCPECYKLATLVPIIFRRRNSTAVLKDLGRKYEMISLWWRILIKSRNGDDRRLDLYQYPDVTIANNNCILRPKHKETFREYHVYVDRFVHRPHTVLNFPSDRVILIDIYRYIMSSTPTLG